MGAVFSPGSGFALLLQNMVPAPGGYPFVRVDSKACASIYSFLDIHIIVLKIQMVILRTRAQAMKNLFKGMQTCDKKYRF